MSKTNKKFIIMLVILFVWIVVLGLFTKKWEFLVNCLSAIGTIGAVIIVLYEKNEGPKIKIYTDYTLEDEIIDPNPHFDENSNYVYSVVTNVSENSSQKLDIYISNEGVVNSLITELNFVYDQARIKLNDKPIIIKNMDVLKINKEHSIVEYHNHFEIGENIPDNDILNTVKLFETLDEGNIKTAFIEAKISTGVVVKSDKIVLNNQIKYHKGDKI